MTDDYMTVSEDFPDVVTPPPEHHPADDPLVLPPTWQPTSLADYATVPPPTPAALPVANGVGLLYPGRSHSAYGEPGSGKSWLLCAALLAALRSDSATRALLVDFEDHPALWASRLRQVGVPEHELTRITYVRPRESLPNWSLLAPLVVGHGLGLVCVDGVTGLFRLHGLDSDSNTDTDRLMGALHQYVCDLGPPLLLADHVTKSRDSRRFAVGSGHKLAAVTGAAYRVEPDEHYPIRRAHLGFSRVMLTKDRPGGIPCAVDHCAALLRLDDRDRPARLSCEPGQGWG